MFLPLVRVEPWSAEWKAIPLSYRTPLSPVQLKLALLKLFARANAAPHLTCHHTLWAHTEAKIEKE